MLEDKVAGQTESMLQIFNKLHLAVHAWSISIHLLNSQVHWTLTLIHTHEVLDVQVLTWNQVIAWVCVFQIVIVCHIAQALAELETVNHNQVQVVPAAVAHQENEAHSVVQFHIKEPHTT